MFRLSRKFSIVVFAFIMAVSPLTVNQSFGADTQSDKTIMAFGDSLVAGYGLKTEDAFPAQLEAKLKSEGLAVHVINAGVSGDTTADGLNRIEWNLARAKPGYVILIMGGNDMLRAIDPAVTKANLQKIMEVLKAHKIPVLVAGMKAFTNLGPRFATAYGSMYKDIAAQHGAVYYPFYLDGVAMKPELNQEDGIHPDKGGVAVIVDKMLPSVKELLKRPAAG
jgi:acyl-CoA thioesterase-1